jgi:predicted nucleic acid-binding protein
MYKRIFLDANILLDTFSTNRPSHLYSFKSYEYILKDINIKLFTSCDIITTIYYVGTKFDKSSILDRIVEVNKTLKVIEFSNKEVSQTCTLMKENKKYKDLEDTMQYILAKKENCDLIISNDENFYADDIEGISSEEFCKKVGV